MTNKTFRAPQSLRLKSGLTLNFTVDAKMGKDGVMYFPETALVREVVSVDPMGSYLIADFVEELTQAAEGLADARVETQYAYEYGGEADRLVVTGLREPTSLEQKAIVTELVDKVRVVREQAQAAEAKERAELARLQAKYA